MAAAATYKKPRAMAGMVNGSLAYDFGTLERQLEDTGRMDPDLYSLPLEETSADVISRAHEHTKAKVRPAQHLSPVLVLRSVAVAALMVLTVLCYVELASISSSVVSMRSQVADLETRQVALMTQYEQAFDLVTIKEKAEAAGMSLPSDSQVYYIDLSDPDNAVVYEQESGGVTKVLEEIWQSILRTVEYFR